MHSLSLRRDNFESRHLGAIALAVTRLENAGVTALSRGELRPDFTEQLVSGWAMRNMTPRQAAVVKRASLGLGDELFDERPKLFCLRLRRLNGSPLDERFCQASHESQLLLAGAAKLLPFLSVTHPYTSSSSSAPTVATLRLGGVP